MKSSLDAPLTEDELILNLPPVPQEEPEARDPVLESDQRHSEW
jgi:hypothetical protein